MPRWISWSFLLISAVTQAQTVGQPSVIRPKENCIFKIEVKKIPETRTFQILATSRVKESDPLVTTVQMTKPMKNPAVDAEREFATFQASMKRHNQVCEDSPLWGPAKSVVRHVNEAPTGGQDSESSETPHSGEAR